MSLPQMPEDVIPDIEAVQIIEGLLLYLFDAATPVKGQASLSAAVKYVKRAADEGVVVSHALWHELSRRGLIA